MNDWAVEESFREIEVQALEQMLKADVAKSMPVIDRTGPSAETSQPDVSPVSVNDSPRITKLSPTGKRTPLWWQPVTPNKLESSEASRVEDRAVLQKKLQRIASKRMQGRDPSFADCVDVRLFCQARGVSAIGMDELKGGQRDSLFRMAVGEVLKAVANEDVSQLEGISPRDFVCGLASDIGVDEERTIVIVSSAVAALARSYILQVTAHLRNDDRKKGKAEMIQLLEVLQQFPTQATSVEMELLASSLEKLLTMQEKSELLNLARRSGTAEASEGIAQALGLSVMDDA
eukprot:7135373-Pyramimonas_sp.AAC.3